MNGEEDGCDVDVNGGGDERMWWIWHCGGVV